MTLLIGPHSATAGVRSSAVATGGGRGGRRARPPARGSGPASGASDRGEVSRDPAIVSTHSCCYVTQLRRACRAYAVGVMPGTRRNTGRGRPARTISTEPPRTSGRSRRVSARAMAGVGRLRSRFLPDWSNDPSTRRGPRPRAGGVLPRQRPVGGPPARGPGSSATPTTARWRRSSRATRTRCRRWSTGCTPAPARHGSAGSRWSRRSRRV